MRRPNPNNGGRPKVAVKLSSKRVVRHIDGESRRRLGISGSEMLRKYHRGKLKDVGEVADLIVWSNILPEDDPIFED